jgi:SpoVK/Ycf46/Vps4 family AAA+-type ATPase
MSERKRRVFLVATANDISRLPPELVRKGRFDEIFFVDLPDAETRSEIFRIHLSRRKLDPEKFDLPPLVELSEGFSGAEIEQAVVSGLYEAHALDKPLDTQTVADELRRTRPLSVTMAERIDELRAWAAERTVPAH